MQRTGAWLRMPASGLPQGCLTLARKGSKMRVRLLGALLLLGGCAHSNSSYMAKLETSLYTATLSSVPPWEGSPIRVVVSPTVEYSRTISWDDVGHPYTMTSDVEDSGGISIEVFNQTDSTLQIDWGRSSLVDASGRTRSLIPSGVNPATLSERPTATSIPPRGQVSETVYPADSLELVQGSWRHKIFLPTEATDKAGAQITMTLAVIRDGVLITVPQPISAFIASSTSTSKSGEKWPKLGGACDRETGCGAGLICTEQSSDFRCVPKP